MPLVRRVWKWRLAASPEALWPLLVDTSRLNEAVGFTRYTLSETPHPDGSVARIGTTRRFGMTLSWDEGVPQWVWARRYEHSRRFKSRLVRAVTTEIWMGPADGGGANVEFRLTFAAMWPVALALNLGGLRRFGKQIDRLFREAAGFAEAGLEQGFSVPRPPAPEAVRRRVMAQAQALAERGHAVAGSLATHILEAPEVELERMRPRKLARLWGVAPRAVIEASLAAVREGMLTLRWDLVCPQCRGVKVTATSLDELPRGAHCPSCNIDFEGDFARNVEVTFEPAPSVRDIGSGGFCLANPRESEHIKVQLRVKPGEDKDFAFAALPNGDYRARTVEPGGSTDFTIANGNIPSISITSADPVVGEDGGVGIHLQNLGPTERHVVIEDRRWAQDALTAHEATTMQAFRDLFADAVLRPGDQVAIGRVAFLFTDIKGSSDLYNRVGDARAYGLVREHYAVLTRAVREHDGAVVKTIGDAVMAAFADPANAFDAALAIREDIAAFNREIAGAAGAEAAIVVKLGLHAGPCIAVTLNDRLDYFGRAVNLAARLQGESRGGDIVLSQAMAEELSRSPGVAERLAALAPVAETARVKGFAEPIALRRIAAAE
jgi:class 3 adenylate cyclase